MLGGRGYGPPSTAEDTEAQVAEGTSPGWKWQSEGSNPGIEAPWAPEWLGECQCPGWGRLCRHSREWTGLWSQAPFK